ncbi:hypothetical protein JTB14_006900 [Gonioctena quinquepunctata]|nr:hypothetical protein JTB14_006900 [Gonioctena quinquepunctata]
MSHVHRAEQIECSLCCKYIERQHFPKHTVTSHKGSKPGTWKCGECDEEFIYREKLRKHYSNSHKECGLVTSKICEICGKTFANLKSLICHQRIHNGENPFQCAECPNVYGTKMALERHFRKHSWVMPHICKHCGKGIDCYNDYVKHMRIHTGETHTATQVKNSIKPKLRTQQKSRAPAKDKLNGRND